MDRNELRQALTPLWKGNTVYNETVMAVAERDTIPAARLVYAPAEILSVRDYGLQTRYQEGSDYRSGTDGTLLFPEGSRVPYVSGELVRGDRIPPELGTQPRAGGGSIPFTETPWFMLRQTAVTYRHAGGWEGPVPKCRPDLLPETVCRLERGGLSITMYGDSIAAGANASEKMNIPPHQPMISDLVRLGLSEWTGADVRMTNVAVGGTDTRWGLQTLPEKTESFRSDLVILAFGMNDGTGKRPAAEYIANTKAMMDLIRGVNPGAEFLLIACMCPNPLTVFLGEQPAYVPALKAMERPGVAVADMWSFHVHLLGRKHYMDMTGNNINHPNDFLGRCYAMNIMAALIPEGKYL